MTREESTIKELKRVDRYLQQIGRSLKNIKEQKKEKEKDNAYRYSKSHR